MVALVIKLFLAFGILVMPGGLLLLFGAALYRRFRRGQPVEIPPPNQARIPAGVVEPEFSRACPSSLCYRP
jgi:hypothetical protein